MLTIFHILLLLCKFSHGLTISADLDIWQTPCKVIENLALTVAKLTRTGYVTHSRTVLGFLFMQKLASVRLHDADKLSGYARLLQYTLLTEIGITKCVTLHM